MNTQIAPSVVAEINRLYETVQELSAQSRQTLDAALGAAWQAGHLLLAEKRRIRSCMGPSSWLIWLEANFKGTPRTAQRYMKLARSVSDASFLYGMSLRQAYARLGIATEPKKCGRGQILHQLPERVILANRLVRTLRRERLRTTQGEQGDSFRRDMRMLFESLRPWFADSPALQRRDRTAQFGY